MSQENAKLKAKADLIMTAIESIQYVSGGNCMRQDLESADIDTDKAKQFLAKTSNDLTEPLWGQWREVKAQLRYNNAKPI